MKTARIKSILNRSIRKFKRLGEFEASEKLESAKNAILEKMNALAKENARVLNISARKTIAKNRYLVCVDYPKSMSKITYRPLFMRAIPDDIHLTLRGKRFFLCRIEG